MGTSSPTPKPPDLHMHSDQETICVTPKPMIRRSTERHSKKSSREEKWTATPTLVKKPGSNVITLRKKENCLPSNYCSSTKSTNSQKMQRPELYRSFIDRPGRGNGGILLALQPKQPSQNPKKAPRTLLKPSEPLTPSHNRSPSPCRKPRRNPHHPLAKTLTSKWRD